MAVEPDIHRWDTLFADRTRAGAGEGLLEILALAGATDVISFAGGFPDPATFPGAIVADILRELAESGDPSPFQYAPTDGLPGPRDYVADRLEAEGRRPGEGELMLTSGSIEALELLGKALVDKGDRVIVEAPTYLGSIMSFQSFEAEVVAVPMDADGLRVDELERVLATGPAPKFVYTIPDFQNPEGVTLSEERREALVELARRLGVLVIEDVAYRQLHFAEEQPTSLYTLAPDVVLQIGTFSKTFFPGVRLGWAAGPADLVAKLVWGKQMTDQCAGALGQRLLEEYGRRGHLDRQLVASRAIYRKRRDAALAALETHLGGRATWTVPAGGFFTWIELAEGDARDGRSPCARSRRGGRARRAVLRLRRRRAEPAHVVQPARVREHRAGHRPPRPGPRLASEELGQGPGEDDRPVVPRFERELSQGDEAQGTVEGARLGVVVGLPLLGLGLGQREDAEQPRAVAGELVHGALDQLAAETAPAPVGPNGHPGDLGARRLVAPQREKADHLPVLDGHEARLRPHRHGALGPPALVSEVVREGEDDGVARRGIRRFERPDHRSSSTWTSSAQSVSGCSRHGTARASSQIAANAR